MIDRFPLVYVLQVLFCIAGMVAIWFKWTPTTGAESHLWWGAMIILSLVALSGLGSTFMAGSVAKE